jgi:hypothetical protein
MPGDISVINDPTVWHYIQYPGELLNLVGIHLPNIITGIQCHGNTCVATLLLIHF